MKSSSNKNTLYVIIGILLVALIGLGAVYYKAQLADKPALSIEVGEDGIDVETN